MSAQMKGVGGLTKAAGIGTVVLEILSTKQEKLELTLNSVFYLPDSPVNLFNPNKIIEKGGCVRKWTIENRDRTEFCALDGMGHLMESKLIGPSSYYTALTARMVDLRMWHRRFWPYGKTQLH